VAAAAAEIPGDAFAPHPVVPVLIVNSVEGLEPGAYGPDLEPIRHGDARRAAGALALWQELAADAAVDLFFLSDLDATLDRLGERGYRVAQLAGGIAGGRTELAATGLGLGATGLTFFDDEATRFFEPAARGRQVMYCAAVGHPV
jgi:nitroreductase